MKRTILLLISIVSIFSVLIAAPIERTTALQYAKQFINQTSVPQFAPGKTHLPQVEQDPTYTAVDVTGTPLYYIYNLSNDGGFVIVAADTRVRTILGYSFNGAFDKNNTPVNMRDWLNEYSSQIEYAVKEMPVSATTPVVARSKSVKNAVAPLLGDIKYDQGAPYNNLCPMDGNKRSYTGCVATAMAQIMRYYQHPLVGRGSKTYTVEKLNQELTVDFSSAYYDWENMLLSYDGTATEVEKTAIATLMYHAGVAVEMKYSASSSTASSANAARALYEYFDYDIGVDEAQRKYFSAGEWLQLIKSEIDEARPVIFSGRSATTGHSFICDGYDADDFVHINWGWGGYQDGYFHLSAFNPKDGGIGAGDTGYNSRQSIFYRIQKPVEGSIPSSIVAMSGILADKDSITGDEKVTFTVSQLRARSLFGFSGQIALALYDEDRNFVQTIRTFTTSFQAGGWGWNTRSFSNVIMSDIRPNDSIVGKFYIKPAYRPEGTDTWKYMLVENGTIQEIQAEITDSVVYFTYPVISFALSEAAPAVVKNNDYTIFKGNRLNIELQIANFGNVEYRAQIGVKAVSLADETKVYELAQTKAILPVGETTTVSLGGVIGITEGEYKLETYYDPANGEETFSFPIEKIEGEISATEITVVETPVPYNLSLAETTIMPSEIERGTPFTYKATITNTGGLFAGDLVLRFLKARNDGTKIYDYIYNAEPYYVEIFTETKEVVIEYTLDLVPGFSYAALLHYTDNATGKNVSFGNTLMNWRKFSVKEKAFNDIIDIDAASDGISIYPNPANTFAIVKINGSANKIQIIDLMGKIVLEEKVEGEEVKIDTQNLSAGIYIVNAGGKTAKLMIRK